MSAQSIARRSGNANLLKQARAWLTVAWLNVFSFILNCAHSLFYALHNGIKGLPSVLVVGGSLLRVYHNTIFIAGSWLYEYHITLF